MKTYFNKILITGGQGQLAQAIRANKHANNFELIFLSKTDCDLTNQSTLKHAMTTHQPDLIINTAAYTNVDQAEDEGDLARQINCDGVANLAKAADNIPIIHLSTDYVFSGEGVKAYKETDETKPINQYGLTKLNGEQALKALTDKHIILRVSGIFSEYGHNFFKTMQRLLNERDSIRVVTDQVICPTYAGNIADCLLSIASQPLEFGTYHYCSSEQTTWFDFTKAIAEESNINTKIEPITSKDFQSKAKRPAYSVLDCTKIIANYNIRQPEWRDALRELCK